MHQPVSLLCLSRTAHPPRSQTARSIPNRTASSRTSGRHGNSSTRSRGWCSSQTKMRRDRHWSRNWRGVSVEPSVGQSPYLRRMPTRPSRNMAPKPSQKPYWRLNPYPLRACTSQRTSAHKSLASTSRALSKGRVPEWNPLTNSTQSCPDSCRW